MRTSFFQGQNNFYQELHTLSRSNYMEHFNEQGNKSQNLERI